MKGHILRRLAACLIAVLLAGGGTLLVPDCASAADAPNPIRETKPLSDKTLVAWVYVANLTQQGGSVLTLQQGVQFDGIVFGELAPGKWMAGSDFWHRTPRDQSRYPVESAGPDTLVQVAIVYQGSEITICRDGREYARHTLVQPQTFGPDSMVLMGLRHVGAGGDACFAGAIEDARIYDRALSVQMLAGLKANQPSQPQPLGWWTFEDGKTTDRMGTFPPGKLVGNTRIEGGKLHLDGKGSYLICGEAPPQPVPDPVLRSPLHFYPSKRAVGDIMPFFWKGAYHVFHLTNPTGNQAVNWEHIVSTNLVDWEELPPALTPDKSNPTGPEGGCMFTGCVVEKDGTFHAWYTSWNENNPAGREFLSHATSKDLITWTKQPQDMIAPDGIHYASHHDRDFRDPQVFWNESAQEYWMHMLANPAQQPGKTVFGLLTSKDLQHWQQQPPVPGVPGDECPDYFRIGDTHYLHSCRRYCYATNVAGPYVYPALTHELDQPHTLAAKRVFDGRRHVWFGGWAGGPMTLPRKVYAGPGGLLYCRPVEEVLARFSRTVLDLADRPPLREASGTWRYTADGLEGSGQGVPAVARVDVPGSYLLETVVRLDAASELVLALRLQENGDAYHFSLAPQRGVLSVAGPGLQHTRPCPVAPSQPVKLQVFVLGGLIECFVNGQFVQTCQAQKYAWGGLGLSVSGGTARFESLKIKTAAEPPRHYHAEGMFHWDTWYVPVGDSVHMFHLQVKRPGSQRLDADNETIGHAVTTDLIHWQELPTALRKGPAGSYDQGALFTGYAVEHAGTIYLFYCGNGPDAQTICLATSTNGIHFQKYEHNPIIKPDGQKYVLRDCRDIVVMKDPGNPQGWIGYVVMRNKDGCTYVLCRSKDLYHWEVGESVFQPQGRYGTFEVAEVFPLGGKWYTTALTGKPYNLHPGTWNDPNIGLATIVGQADSACGPFAEVHDNFLLASTDTPWQGFSARSVLFRDERLLLYSRGEGTKGSILGRLAWPLKLAPRKEGGLNPMYWPGIDAAFGPATDLPRDGRPTRDAVFMATVTVELKDAKAGGIAFGNYQALLDTAGQVSLVEAATSKAVQNRMWPILPATAHALRLLVVNGMVDVYLDDVLVINYYLPKLGSRGVSLVNREGTCRFSQSRYRAGNLTRQENLPQ